MTRRGRPTRRAQRAAASALVAVGLLAAASAHAEQRAWVELSWKPITGAVAYELQIGDEPRFARPRVTTRLVQSPFRWDVVPEEPHYWRLRAVDGSGVAGQWSPARLIEGTLRQPIIEGPDDGAEVQLGDELPAVSLAWSGPPIIAAYVLEVAADAAFTRIVHSERTERAGIRVELPEAGRYWWRVSAIDLAGYQSDPSKPRAVVLRLASPAPLSPSPTVWDDAGEAVILRWRGPPAARSWRVEVEPPVGERSSERTRDPELRYTIDATGTYRWRVVGLDAEGAWGRHSDWNELVVGPRLTAAPRWTSPAAGASVDGAKSELSLAWQPLALAASYEVTLAADGAASAGEPRIAAAAHARLELPRPGAYVARVRGRTAEGRVGPWSEVRFTIQPPARRRLAVEPSELEVLADGTSTVALRVRLVDAKGRTIASKPPTVDADVGRVEVVAPEPSGVTEGTFRVVYTAPAAAPREGVATVAIRIGEVSTSVPVRLTVAGGEAAPPAAGGEAVVWLGARAGVTTNFGAGVSPVGGVSLEVALPIEVLPVHLGVRVSYFRFAVDVRAWLGQPTPASIDVVPISAVVLWAPRFGEWSLFAGGGPGAQTCVIAVGERRETTLAPALDLVAGAAYALGPGEAFVDLSGGVALIDSDLSAPDAWAGHLTVGYRFGLQ